MSRVLIVYGTTHGQTAKITEALARTLGSYGSLVDVMNVASKPWLSPAGYNAVIVAASIHSGGFQRTVNRWARTYAHDLNQKPTAFIPVCLAVLDHSDASRQAIEKIMQNFFMKTGWLPTFRKVVAGALPYSKYSWFTRRLMRQIVAKTGGDTDMSRDYEYTDWKDLEAFAREFHDRALAHTVALRAIA